ncbi:MAG: hypothetical protein V3V33_07050 [Candidatus Lokiarchaeia archaeon]
MNDKDPDLEVKISELAKEVNPVFFEWLKSTIKLDVIRSLEINTFLLNYFISLNYFPAHELIDKIYTGKEYTEEQLNDLKNFRDYTERMHGIFILMTMIYDSEVRNKKRITDRIIDQMDLFGELVNQFFFLNTNPSNIEVNRLLERLEDFSTVDIMLPNLEFDPEYRKILDSDTIKQIFHVATPLNEPNPKRFKDYKYFLSEEQYHEFHENKFSEEILFDIDPKLKWLPGYCKKGANYFWFLDFGSHDLINEFIRLFKEYFCLRVPLKKEEIETTLDCYSVLFKLSEGKFYSEIKWKELSNKLETSISKNFVLNFLERFCLEKQFNEFDNVFENFNPQNFLNSYNEFLKYAGFVYHGTIRTGALLIWRSMIKYFEELQQDEDFRNLKGKMLEKWCYEEALKRDLKPEKLILIDPRRTPTPKYFLMKEEIKSFPKPAIEVEAELILGHPDSYFREIDLIIKIEELLLIIECKGTKAPLGEEGKYVNWTSRFYNVLNDLYEKYDIITFNIEKGILKDPIFDGVEEIIPMIIQTEGIFDNLYGYTTHKFIKALERLEQHKKAGTINELFN